MPGRLAVVPFFLFLSIPGIATSPSVSHMDINSSGIKLLSPTERQGAALLGIRADSVYHSGESVLSPYSVILQNNSGKNIAGYTLVWKITDASGKTRTVPKSFTDPHVLRGNRVLDGGYGIRDGDHRIVTPSRNLSSEEFARFSDLELSSLQVESKREQSELGGPGT